MIILGLDPAIKNFGYSVFGSDPNKCYESGILKNPVNEMGVESQKLIKNFLEEISNIIDKYKVDNIVVERFQARNISRDIQIECVNTMIGALLTLDIPVRLIYASHWKNEINRVVSTYGYLLDNKKKLGEPLHQSIYPRLRCTPHEFDASCIALYGFETSMKPFKEFLGTEEDLSDYVNKIQANSTSKPKRKPEWNEQ